jgi:RNase P subunit RPR2
MVNVVGKDTTVVKRVTCRNCASMLEYTPSETFTETHYDYGGGSDNYTKIICPSCGKKIIVK